ncbi:unnamed protein product [Blumeria hordei]|uniref:Uncharacterized protein n=1 Tax=Blumeria hordei TaxID=2867405 RepID=A0A383UNX8_BLUHO|nr:unnamed protein product [Blumeria hordei]
MKQQIIYWLIPLLYLSTVESKIEDYTCLQVKIKAKYVEKALDFLKNPDNQMYRMPMTFWTCESDHYCYISALHTDDISFERRSTTPYYVVVDCNNDFRGVVVSIGTGYHQCTPKKPAVIIRASN